MGKEIFKGEQAAIRLNTDDAHERTGFPVVGLTKGQRELLRECITIRLGNRPSATNGTVQIRSRIMGSVHN